MVRESGVPLRATPLGVDNQSAKQTTEDPASAKRTKHIDVRYHFCRWQVEAGEIALAKVHTDKNPADLLTKPLGKEKFLKHRDSMMRGDLKDE